MSCPTDRFVRSSASTVRARRPHCGWRWACCDPMRAMSCSTARTSGPAPQTGPLLWFTGLAVMAYLGYAFAPRPGRRTADHATDWFGAGALLAAVLAWYGIVAQVEPPSWRGGVLLVLAVVHLVAAVGWRRPMLAVVAGLVSAGGLVYAMAAVALVLERNVVNVPDMATELVLEGLLLVVWGAAVVWAVRALAIKGAGGAALVVAVGATLAGVMVAVVGLGAMVGTAIDDVRGALIGAHAIVSIVWMLIAAVLLAFGLRRGRSADLGIKVGLVVAGLAVLKLFLYDLAALDGLWRGIAFLVVGLLLAVGTGYAKALAQAKAGQVSDQPGSADRPAPTAAPAPPGVVHPQERP